MLKDCCLCAWKCHANRVEHQGVCKCGALPKLARASVHMWEEPCISGKNGSGTVFFSGCNFHCEFCQNYEISQNQFGKEVSIQRLAEILIELQEKNVHNINLVSPTPYVDSIIEALKLAKENGLCIPVIYNTNSYETVETIKELQGYVDVYLPDLKYASNETALRLSKVSHYFETATAAICEMVSQVGAPEFDKQGIIQKGVIIRHLALPGHLTETKKVIEWVSKQFDDKVYFSLMAQYFPTYNAKNHEDINRKLSKKEYQFLMKMVEKIENGYMQELSDGEEEYVPDFDLSGV